MDVDSLAGSLVMVVMQWNQCGMWFEPGKQSFLRACTPLTLCFRLLAGEEGSNGATGKQFIHTWVVF